jgi:hypothetical protein
MKSVPVFGGTLDSAPAIGALVAADPEGNRLLRLVGDQITAVVDLGDNARPFRIHVEGARSWVTLRGTGELASIDLDSAELEWRTRVCLEPRGVARSSNDRLLVACAGGELVELDDDGNVLRLAVIDSDLRDIVTTTDGLLVSRFATAQILSVDPTTLTITEKIVLGSDAGVAWRMRPYDDHALVLHQAATEQAIRITEGDGDFGQSSTASYGASLPGCSGTIVDTGLTEVSAETGVEQSATLVGVSVGTDFVLVDRGRVAVVSAGASDDRPEVAIFDRYDRWFEGCRHATDGIELPTTGRASALAIDADGALVVQTAGPFTLTRDVEGPVVVSERWEANSEMVQLFHTDPGVGVACASCHPEGLDDGHVWTFSSALDGSTLVRRTMPLAGLLLSRQPYHWDAALDDPDALMADTFVSRMGGTIDAETTADLFDWLDGLRHVRAHPATDQGAIAIGRAAFDRAECGTCHSGPAFTNNTVASIGGTEDVKVPTLLGVGLRNHILHDGSLLDLDERFRVSWADGFLPTNAHGNVTALTDDEIEALKAYLRTL